MSVAIIVIFLGWNILIILIIMIELILFLLSAALIRSSHGSHDGVAQSHYWPQWAPAEVCQVDLTELPEKWKVESLLNILRQGGDLLLEVIYSLRNDLLVDVGDS